MSILFTAKPEVTILDVFTPKFRLLTNVAYKVLSPYTESESNFERARKMRKLQSTLDDNVPFPCNTTASRSSTRPVSVHALRPGDIDVIGAFGDSLTAGNGIIATDLLQVAFQNRGLSFSGGGQYNWRKFTTLPNILKEFNPNLIGYATKDSFINHIYSQLNVAEASAMSRDMPFMSNELIKRIKNNPKINLKEDWKMISLLIGGNDFCSDICYHKNPKIVIENHRQDLLQTIRNLRDNLPRTILNLILAPHLSTIRGVTLQNRPPICYFTHNTLCPCLFGLQFRNKQKLFDEIMTNWQNIEKEIADKEEFDRDDFTVVAQPFTENYDIKRYKNGLVDYSVFSFDCFHLSQKEHGRSATSLWNNLLEPVGTKSSFPYETFNFLCPSEEHPFIYTRRNSKNNTN